MYPDNHVLIHIGVHVRVPLLTLLLGKRLEIWTAVFALACVLVDVMFPVDQRCREHRVGGRTRATEIKWLRRKFQICEKGVLFHCCVGSG